MVNENVNKIEFDYNGKHYLLEYTLDTIREMEANGFNINDIDNKPGTRIPQLWNGAFFAHERRTSNAVKKELYSKLSQYNDELLQTLSTMYINTLANLTPEKNENDEGNIKWVATP